MDRQEIKKDSQVENEKNVNVMKGRSILWKLKTKANKKGKIEKVNKAEEKKKKTERERRKKTEGKEKVWKCKWREIYKETKKKAKLT